MKRLILILIVAFLFLGYQKPATERQNETEAIQRQADQIIQNLIPRYHDVERIFDLANISNTDDDEVFDENDDGYYVVNSDPYRTIHDLKEATESVCTNKLAGYYFNRAFAPEVRPLFKEINGQLCRCKGEIRGRIDGFFFS